MSSVYDFEARTIDGQPQKLDQFKGNFVTAELVKAFITSTEYRQRFGP